MPAGPDRRARARVLPTKITGRIADWKGSFGWIAPDQAIDHPEAALHRGRIYLSQTDVEAEIAGVGSAVSFYVYADGTGLGASNCRPTEAPKVVKTVAKPVASAVRLLAPRAVSSQAQQLDGRKRVSNAQVSGVVNNWKGTFGWIIPMERVNHTMFKGKIYFHLNDVASGAEAIADGVAVSFFVYVDKQGLGAEGCVVGDPAQASAPRSHSLPPADTQASGLSMGAGPGGVKPSANLPRERVTLVATTGEVIDWRGNYGWLVAHDGLDHPMANRRQGKIYLSAKDIVGGEQLQVGQLVQFHVFADPSGLGAEECQPF